MLAASYCTMAAFMTITSLGASALRHYAYRLPALEHRFLVEILQLARVEACTLVFVFCQAPGAEVIDYYLSLLPPEALTRVGAADLAKYHHWQGAPAEEK
jgi:hypothetical protein